MALAKVARISFSDLNKIMSKERCTPDGNPANGSAAERACGTCGAALMRTASGKSKVITSLRDPDRSHP